jgi:hypothetical protein
MERALVLGSKTLMPYIVSAASLSVRTISCTVVVAVARPAPGGLTTS